MKFLAMRDLNVQDPLPTLGPKVEPPAKPAASGSCPTERLGVFKKPDGKLETRIPENERVRDSFVCEGTQTRRIPSSAPALGLPYVKPGSNLNGKRPQMMVLGDLVATDYSVHEERLVAAWYAKYKELCK